MEKIKEISIINKLEDYVDDSEYNVILLNDDVTPFDYVVAVLASVFQYEIDSAVKTMLHVHENGSAIVATMSMEAAYAKVEEVDKMNERFGFMLQTDVQKA